MKENLIKNKFILFKTIILYSNQYKEHQIIKKMINYTITLLNNNF